MTDHERERIAIAYGSAAHVAGLPSMRLGMWAGRGDYASIPIEARDKAGVNALADIDTAIEGLVAARNAVADAVFGGDAESRPGLAWVQVGDQEPVQVQVRWMPDGNAYVAHGHRRLAAQAALDEGSAAAADVDPS